GAELVIRTAAVHDVNPEIAAAREAGIPVFERAQAWGSIIVPHRHAARGAGADGGTGGPDSSGGVPINK
ncbi:Mur ligase domain-containing protein, partial [Intestinimonas massiliensis]